MQVNDIVIFSPRAGESAEGIVTRVWDKPASDPYVTVRTTEDAGRTFTRCQSAVILMASSHLHPSCNCVHEVTEPCDRGCPVHAGSAAADAYGRVRA